MDKRTTHQEEVDAVGWYRPWTSALFELLDGGEGVGDGARLAAGLGNQAGDVRGFEVAWVKQIGLATGAPQSGYEALGGSDSIRSG